MELNIAAYQFVTNSHWLVLKSIEHIMLKYEFAPKSALQSNIKLRKLPLKQLLGDLLNFDLLTYEGVKVHQGYRLTWKGFDYLALHHIIGAGLITSVGPRIGIGKEADIHIVYNNETSLALKIHRLGRTSFRSVRKNRDYLRKGSRHQGWIHLSAKSAEQEFKHMKLLKTENLPIPEPIDHNRHVVLMEFAKGVQLNKIRELEQHEIEHLVNNLYQILIDIAKLGYVHGDYNEFNIIVDEENVVSANSITIIDFPQCLKTSHHAAPEYFDRDSMSIKLFFERRFKYVLDQIPTWADIQAELNLSELDSNEADFNSGQDEEKSDGEEIFEVLQSDIENEENHEISK